ncbi:hypothetical protein P692DRAFT_20870187 [Suillus brevipes Sb2]|nr:hypothetical protein P692DRAFT_20870187 [Suillus brevipes Sb2]
MTRAASISYNERSTKHARETLSPLYDHRIWMIFETFLTSPSSYGDVLMKVRGYLGKEFVESEWSEVMTALFLGDEDNELSLTNFRIVKAKYLTDGQATSTTLATECYQDVKGDAEEVVEVEEDELEDEETIPEASTSRLPPIPQKNLPIPPTAKQRMISTNTLTVSIASSTGQRLGWSYSRVMAIRKLALANFLTLKRQHLLPPSTSKSSAPRSRPVKNPFIDLEAKQDDEEDELEDKEEYRPATVTRLPACRHDLSEAIARIKVNATINVPARQYLADKMEKMGFSIVISPWVPLHLYITSNSPHTIMPTVPVAYQMALKRWDCIPEEEENTVNALSLQFPYPCWLRIKRGTTLKGSVALFKPSRLLSGISPTDIILNGEVVSHKYKGEEYYGSLLKKCFH